MYDEEARSAHPRSWVQWHFRNGYSCLQSEHELALNLRAMHAVQAAASRPPLAVYASVEDMGGLLKAMPSLRAQNMSSLGAHEGLVSAAKLQLPPSLASILLDQLTCAHASVLVLNAFSTFSQLVMGRVSLHHRRGLGWVRDLSKEQQRALGVHVVFWRRANPDNKQQLLGKGLS